MSIRGKARDKVMRDAQAGIQSGIEEIISSGRMRRRASCFEKHIQWGLFDMLHTLFNPERLPVDRRNIPFWMARGVSK
jgi:hypothetical protein